MSRPVILFSTVYPADLHHRHALVNTRMLFKEWRGMEMWESDLRALAGTVHRASAERMQEVLDDIPVKGEVRHYPFKYRKEMNSEWMHEIAYVKREVMKDCLEQDFDVLLFVDSDIEIDFNSVYSYIEMVLEHGKKTAVQFPYCLRGKRAAPPGQMGAFLVSKKALGKGILDWIYSTVRENGKLKRWMAPDCGIKQWLKKNNVRIVRAGDVDTVHWNEDGGWRYRKGKCLRPVDKEL